MQVDSTTTPKIYQVHPLKRTKSTAYTQDCWTTTDGYRTEANLYANCIERANHRDYTHFVSINIMEDFDHKTMRDLWTKSCRYLRDHGIICLWVVEASKRSNRFNYHLLIRSGPHNMKAILKKATSTYKTNIQCAEWDDGKGKLAARYMFKAEVFGQDKYKRKRTIFAPEHKMTKAGAMNGFWGQNRNKEHFEKELADINRQVKEGMMISGAEWAVDDLHAYFDGTISRNRLRRAVGYFAPKGFPNVERWTF